MCGCDLLLSAAHALPTARMSAINLNLDIVYFSNSHEMGTSVCSVKRYVY